jgi:hypothetical protein
MPVEHGAYHQYFKSVFTLRPREDLKKISKEINGTLEKSDKLVGWNLIRVSRGFMKLLPNCNIGEPAQFIMKIQGRK